MLPMEPEHLGSQEAQAMEHPLKIMEHPYEFL